MTQQAQPCANCDKEIVKSEWSRTGWRHVITGSAMCAPISYAMPIRDDSTVHRAVDSV